MAKSYFLRFGVGDPRTYTGLSPTFLIFASPSGTTFAPPSISEILASGIYTFTWGTTAPIGFLIDGATTTPGADGRFVAGAIDPADRIDEIGATLVAIGTSHIAQGVSLTAQGVSILAIGISHLAQGTSITAQGVSLTAQGVSIFALGVSSLALSNAIGSTQTQQGVILSSIDTDVTDARSDIQAVGVTNQAIGVSLMAIGASIYAGLGSGGSLSTDILARIGTTASTFGDSSTDPGTLYGFLKRMQEFNEGDASFVKSSGSWAISSRGGSLLATKTLANSSSTVTKS